MTAELSFESTTMCESVRAYIFSISNRDLLSRKSKMECFIPIENLHIHAHIESKAKEKEEKVGKKWQISNQMEWFTIDFHSGTTRKFRMTETCFAYFCCIALMISMQQLNLVLEFWHSPPRFVRFQLRRKCEIPMWWFPALFLAVYFLFIITYFSGVVWLL